MSDGEVTLRQFKKEDLEVVKALTIASFNENSSIDKRVEDRFGPTGTTGWQERKASHIDDDVAANAKGIFVAVLGEKVVGYITTSVSDETKMGRIPNMAVDGSLQGKGIGRKLLNMALDYFRDEGMELVKIETLASNSVGQHLYPSIGFEEIARQVHFVMPLK